MKIVLVKPPFGSSEEYGDLSSFGSCEPPLGLCYLASYLREKGYDVSIIDAIAERLSFEEVVERVIDGGAEVMGLSAETPVVSHAAKVAYMVKKREPNITTILGGTHITAVPIDTMKAYPQIDYGVLGEGEVTLYELLNTLKRGENTGEIHGLVLRDPEVVITARRELLPSLDSLPMPAWDLLPDLTRYYFLSSYSVKKKPSISLVTSRGCGYKCSFCFQGVFKRKVRRHSPQYIIKMVKHLYHQYGIREIRFQDDNFMSHRKNLSTLCDSLIEENLNISWSCLARTENINDETLRKMKRSGCWQILLGIETGSPKILKEIDKSVTLEKIEESLHYIRRARMRSVGYFMIGYPGETKETIKETIAFAKKIPLDDFRMNYIVPFPETELHAQAVKSGTLQMDWDKMNFFKGPCYIPEDLTEKEIVQYRKKAFLQFYFRPTIMFSYMRDLLERPAQLANFARGGWVMTKFFLNSMPALLRGGTVRSSS